MTKKPERSRREPTSDRQLLVRDSAGRRNPFLRGMVTHDLVERGLSFDDAYAIAQAVRDALRDRAEVDTRELRQLIDRQLERSLGPEGARRLLRTDATQLRVVYHGQEQPFSRGLLARSLYAGGLDLDRAYALVAALEEELRHDRSGAIRSDEIARRAGDLLEREEGVDAAGRYRLMRQVHRLPRPLVIYIGGASGTGKSTLSLELAPLLRIYRVNATDTIRQVMRMVFSPAILPDLHRSSFEATAAWESAGEDRRLATGDAGRQQLVGSFDEQAARVLVGVRAVVERAVAERMSILVEGVHLVPGLIPFPDLEGSVYQIPLLLTTFGEEVHRSRVLSRSRTTGRRPERYLRHFEAIRQIHQHLAQLAETHETPLLDTSDFEAAVPRALRLVTDALQQRLPALARAVQTPVSREAPTLLLAVDGMPDRPLRALGGRTPLEAARTPTLDRLAAEGQCGLADPVAPGVVPDTAAGTLALLGQSPFAMKRGPVEALGSGLELAAGDIALRGNFATLDERGWVVDRRAGRIREGGEELASALDRLPLPGGLYDDVEIRVRRTTEHRLSVVLRGEGLSSSIEGSDPGDGAPPGPPLAPRPRDPEDEAAGQTAQILALFEQEARRVLGDHPVNRRRRERGEPPASCVLTRGAGRLHRLLPLEEGGRPLRLTCISGDRTVLGLAAWLEAATVSSTAMTANLDTDLAAKFAAAARALASSDLVLLHVKGADIAAHDRRPDLKVEFLERVDRELAALLERWDGPLRIAVAADHATLAEVGQHAADPLPVLLWGVGVVADEVQTFDERRAAGGSLRRFPLQMLLSRLFELA
ncbi:MAG TPA: hypothetical protein VMT16_16470 [Thermoanaerobaculia bacterium]|nr:hypothetical protein [Thermoanaerobaculia bacterium]